MKTADLLHQAFGSARGAFLLTGIDGTALYANTALERRTGFTVGEIIGKAPGKLWGGTMPRDFYARFWTAIQVRQEPFVATVTNVRKDKVRYQELLAVAPITSEEGVEYFIALSVGHIEDEEERERFQREFREVFSPQARFSEEDRLRFVLRSLGSGQAVPASGTRPLKEIFQEALVAPFQERFRARKEDRLLILAAQTDPQQFQALYDKYRQTIFLYFVRHIEGSTDVAEDLTQDTFYRALRYLGSFRLTNASYGTYLLRVAHNVLVNYFRKKQFLALIEDVAEDEAVETDISSGDALWRSPKLLETEQKILSMKYQEGFSVQEIAATLNKSENAVKLQLSRARKKLRAVLGA